MYWKEISPEDADSLVSCGATVEYCMGDEDAIYGWEVWDWKGTMPSSYYNWPPVGAKFRVQVE